LERTKARFYVCARSFDLLDVVVVVIIRTALVREMPAPGDQGDERPADAEDPEEGVKGITHFDLREARQLASL
jgi:hypothetical protein